MDSSDSHDSSDSASPSRSPSPKRRHASNGLAEDASKAVSCIRFLVSNSAAGSVIGKGGATISEFQSQSGCKIQLSRNHEYYPGTNDRIISLNGTISEMLTALNLILSKLFNEAEDDSDVDQKTNQGLMPQMVGMRSSFPGAVPLLQSGRQTTATIAVPDEHVGAIVGRGGRVITEIQQASGANIKISDRGDFLSGTNDRKVTITGSAECIRVAKRMLKQKVEQSVSSEFER